MIFLERGLIKFNGSVDQFKDSGIDPNLGIYLDGRKDLNSAEALEELKLMQEKGEEFFKSQIQENINNELSEESIMEEEENMADFFLAEDKVKGEIKMKILFKLFRMSLGYYFHIICAIAIICAKWLFILMSIMKETIGSKMGQKENVNELLFKFCMLAVTSCSLMIITSFMLFTSFMKMSRKIHARMTFKLLHSEMDKFIQRIPIGLIVNRFSTDINVLDTGLPTIYLQVMLSISQLLSGFTLVASNLSYLMFFFYALYLFFLFRLRKRYSYVLKETTRAYYITKSPIVTETVTCIAGAPILRTLENEKDSRKSKAKLKKELEDNFRQNMMLNALQKWYIISDITMALFLCDYSRTMAIVFTLLSLPNNIEKSKVAGMVAGIENSSAFTTGFSQLFQYNFKLEQVLISFERCNSYLELKSESGYKTIEED